jgi:hypothetical protein
MSATANFLLPRSTPDQDPFQILLFRMAVVTGANQMERNASL